MSLDHILEETYQDIIDYIDDELEEKGVLYELCKNCEYWMGRGHDYAECRDKACFKCYLAYEHLNELCKE